MPEECSWGKCVVLKSHKWLCFQKNALHAAVGSLQKSESIRSVGSQSLHFARNSITEDNGVSVENWRLWAVGWYEQFLRNLKPQDNDAPLATYLSVVERRCNDLICCWFLLQLSSKEVKFDKYEQFQTSLPFKVRQLS